MRRRGVTYSLRPSQIAYVLPGGGYDEEGLRATSQAAEALCGDGRLMELAWEVCSRPAVAPVVFHLHPPGSPISWRCIMSSCAHQPCSVLAVLQHAPTPCADSPSDS